MNTYLYFHAIFSYEQDSLMFTCSYKQEDLIMTCSYESKDLTDVCSYEKAILVVTCSYEQEVLTGTYTYEHDFLHLSVFKNRKLLKFTLLYSFHMLNPDLIMLKIIK